MNYVFKITAFIAIGLLSFFLQSFNILKVGSVNPNLILAFFASLLIYYNKKDFVSLSLPVAAAILVWAVDSMPFWIKDISIVFAVMAVVTPFYFNFTGNHFLDTLILIFGLTFLFYIPFWAIGAQSLNLFVFWEALYNIIFGFVFSFIVANIDYSIEKI